MHLEQLEAVDWALDPLTLDLVRDDHLRVSSGTVENDYIERLIRVSYRRAERGTRRSLIPQQKALVLDAFPCAGEPIVIPAPPLLTVASITYVDVNGDEQVLTGSPATFDVSRPSGPTAGKGEIRPVYGARWPLTRAHQDAVTVAFTAGYPLVGTPALADIPEDILHGRLLVIAEMYKTRSESVTNQSPALMRARDLWLDYRAY